MIEKRYRILIYVLTFGVKFDNFLWFFKCNFTGTFSNLSIRVTPSYMLLQNVCSVEGFGTPVALELLVLKVAPRMVLLVWFAHKALRAIAAHVRLFTCVNALVNFQAWWRLEKFATDCLFFLWILNFLFL